MWGEVIDLSALAWVVSGLWQYESVQGAGSLLGTSLGLRLHVPFRHWWRQGRQSKVHNDITLFVYRQVMLDYFPHLGGGTRATAGEPQCCSGQGVRSSFVCSVCGGCGQNRPSHLCLTDKQFLVGASRSSLFQVGVFGPFLIQGWLG